MAIRLSKSSLSEAEIASVVSVLRSEFLGMGPKVKELECSLVQFLKRPVVAVASGTAAIQLALQSLGLQPGDEVLVPSLTYVASFQAITAAGLVPVACDIDRKTLCISPDSVRQNITPKSRVIMPVHYSGGVGCFDDILSLAKEFNLRVVEDAAHAFGTKYNGKRIGSFGDITCFSFDGIKNMTCGEGGCVVSDDPDVSRKVSDARLLGVIGDAEKRYQMDRSWGFDVSDQGWRYHMSDIMAAIGVEQLKRFSELSKKRQALAKVYHAVLQNHDDIEILSHDYSEVVPHIFPIILKKNVNRNEVRFDLATLGIQTGLHYTPNHLHTKFNKSARYELTSTMDVANQLLTLPLHPDLSVSEIHLISDSLKVSVGINKRC